MDQYLEYSCPLTSKKYKEDHLDWQILRADLILNFPNMMRGQDNDECLAKAIYKSLMGLGCSLAALGRFAEAAPLYEEIGETF